MKNKIFLVSVIILALLGLVACDSLWNVSNGTNVNFNLNLEDYLPKSNRSSVLRSSVPLGDDDDSYSIYVGLYYGSNDTLIEEVKLTQNDVENRNAANLRVEFENVPTGVGVYASVKILNDTTDYVGDPLHFSAVSDIERLKKGENKLEAKPNVVFYDGSALSYAAVSSDDNSRSVSNNEVLGAAIDMLGGEDRIKRGATIYVSDLIDMNQGNTSWEYPGLTLKRGKDYSGVLISGSAGGTLSAVTLDGNREYYTADGPLLYLNRGDPFTIKERVILQNNNNIKEPGGGLRIDGPSSDVLASLDFSGTIRNNTSPTGGGLYALDTDITFNTGAGIYDNNVTDSNDKGNGILLNGGSLKAISKLETGVSTKIPTGQNLYVESNTWYIEFFAPSSISE